MSELKAQMRKFSRRLMVYESLGQKPAGIKNPAAFHVCEKLRPSLATLAGNGGFRALLTRALALASAEVPWLRTVQVKTDGVLDGAEELQAQLGPDKIFEGRVVLVAQLLGLLVAFIGEDLTVQLVREVWPRIPLNDLGLGNTGKK